MGLVIVVLIAGIIALIFGKALSHSISEKIEKSNNSKLKDAVKKLSTLKGTIVLIASILMTIVGLCLLGNTGGFFLLLVGIVGISVSLACDSSEKGTARNNSTQRTSSQQIKQPSGWTWIIIILILGGLLSMCDGRSEAEKWEDSYKGAFEEYADFYGWYYD